MMVNGRISDRSMKRYKYISAFTREMLRSIERFCMQSKFDAAYIESLGAHTPDITVTGNMKYDQTYATVSYEENKLFSMNLALGIIILSLLQVVLTKVKKRLFLKPSSKY